MLPEDDKLLRDRYKILSLLGHGGMGSVHLAYDTALDVQVAVKSNRNSETSSQEQFLREARLLATLRHPSLPRVIDHFIVGDTQYLVMDFVPGRDLETILKEEGIPPVHRILDWTHQLVSALTYLHNQNPPVIHRDIKPANVKITPEGQAILVDFGLAKAADPTQATAAGATGYTPGYAPPEQYGGSHTGPYSDQYSLAATLYKLFTNQKPVESIKRLLGEAVLTPMQGLNPAVPQFIQSAIEKAMSLQPQDRFSSMQAFLNALNDPTSQTVSTPTLALGEQTVLKAPATVQPSVPVKSGRKSSKWLITCAVLAAAGLVLSLVGAGVWFFFLRNHTPQLLSNQATSTLEVLAVAVEETPELTSTDEPALQPSVTETEEVVPASTETSEPSKPTDTVTPTSKPSPVFLVNENRVVFVSDRADGSTWQLWTMQIGQTLENEILAMNLQQITFDEGDKSQPEWSPDGTKIIYSAPASKGAKNQIWLLDLSTEGAQPVMLTDLDGSNFEPTWSSDGTRIAFVNFGRYTDVYALYVMDANGKNLKRLSIDFQETDPEWTPDMQWLLYVLHGNGHQYFYWRNQTDDYATPAPFDPTSHFGRMGEVNEPSISPDGSYMVYTRQDGPDRQIWTVDFSSRGASTLLLTDGYFAEYEPAWSPDGQWIVFTSERDGNQEIYVMTSVGLLQTNLTQDRGADLQPDWYTGP